MTQEMQSVSRVCPYCGGIVSKRGWIVSSERLTADGYIEQIDQLVHKRCTPREWIRFWKWYTSEAEKRAGRIL